MKCIKIVSDDGRNRRRCKKNAVDGGNFCRRHLNQKNRKQIKAKELADRAHADYLRRQRKKAARAKRRIQYVA